MLFVADIIDDTYKVYNFEILKNIFNIPSLNLLEYYRLRGLIKNFLKKYRPLGDTIEKQKYMPILPFHIQTIHKSPKGSKDMYRILNSSSTSGTPEYKSKWSHDLQYMLNEKQWKEVFKCCFKTFSDKKLIWFQYRIIHRILGTKKLLFKMDILDNPNCRLCGNFEESLYHLFIQCEKTVIFKNDIFNWLNEILNTNFDYSPQTLLLGYFNTKYSYIPINTFLVVAKYHIFLCAYQDRNLNIFEFQRMLYKAFKEEELLAKISFQSDRFNKIWQRWRPFLSNIEE